VRRSVGRGSAWTACLIAMWLMSCLAYAEPSTPESSECETLLEEAEVVILDLLAEVEAWKKAHATLSIESERIVLETAETAAAETARPFLIEIAGLRAERDALRRRIVPWVVGGILTGLVAGVVIGGLL
jgi:hypothetical protein